MKGVARHGITEYTHGDSTISGFNEFECVQFPLRCEKLFSGRDRQTVPVSHGHMSGILLTLRPICSSLWLYYIKSSTSPEADRPRL